MGAIGDILGSAAYLTADNGWLVTVDICCMAHAVSCRRWGRRWRRWVSQLGNGKGWAQHIMIGFDGPRSLGKEVEQKTEEVEEDALPHYEGFWMRASSYLLVMVSLGCSAC